MFNPIRPNTSTSLFSVTNSLNNTKKAIHKALTNPNVQAALGVATIATATVAAYYFTQSTPTSPPAPFTYDGSLPCQGMSFANSTLDTLNKSFNSSLFASSLEQNTTSINHTLYDFSNKTSSTTPNFSNAVKNTSPSLAPTSPAANYTKQFLDLLRSTNHTSHLGSNNATNLTSNTNTTLNLNPAAIELVNNNTFKATNLLQDKSEPCQGMSFQISNSTNLTFGSLQEVKSFTYTQPFSQDNKNSHLTDNRQLVSSISPQAFNNRPFKVMQTYNLASDLSNPSMTCSQNPETLEEHLAALSSYFIKTQIPSIQARVANEFHVLYNWTESFFKELLNEKADRKAFYDTREFSKILYGVNKQNKQCAEVPTTLTEKADALVSNALINTKESVHNFITSQLTALENYLSGMDKELAINFINTINLIGTANIVAAARILAKNKHAAESSFIRKFSTFTLIAVPLGLIRINSKPIASEAIAVDFLKNRLVQWVKSSLTATLDYFKQIGK